VNEHRPRIGLDLAPLCPGGGAPRGANFSRWLLPAARALRARSDLHFLGLGPQGVTPRRFRHLLLPAAARASRVLGVHSFTSGFAPLAPGFRVQTVHELPWRHGVEENASRAHRLWVAYGARYADTILCATEVVAAELAAEQPRAAHKIRVVPWGVDPALLARPLPVEHRAPRLLLTSGGRTKKRAALAVAALAHLPAEWELLVTGPEGPGLAAARQRAAALGVAARLRVLGPVDDGQLPELFASCSAVLCLAASEGFGLPVLEGLALGTPVIHPPGGAQAEVAGPCGLAAEVEDPRQLAAAIERGATWTAEQRRAARGRAAQFPWERYAATVADVWRRLLARGHP
jgi:glycosyltransferase involved in cell wall biosynthesis